MSPNLDPAWVAAMHAAIQVADRLALTCACVVGGRPAEAARATARALRHALRAEEHAQRCRDAGLPVTATAADCRAVESAGGAK